MGILDITAVFWLLIRNKCTITFWGHFTTERDKDKGTEICTGHTLNNPGSHVLAVLAFVFDIYRTSTHRNQQGTVMARGRTLQFHNFSWTGDPKWSGASRFTVYAPAVVCVILVLSIAQISFGSVWLVQLESHMSV